MEGWIGAGELDGDCRHWRGMAETEAPPQSVAAWALGAGRTAALQPALAALLLQGTLSGESGLRWLAVLTKCSLCERRVFFRIVNCTKYNQETRHQIYR